MDLKDNTIIFQTKDEIFSEIENDLKTFYGANFKVKSDGILDTIIKILVDIEIRVQENLQYFIKQFNPESSDNVWQDAMYERMGVTRLDENTALFSKQVLGNPNTKIKAKTLLIRSESSEDQEFLNLSDFNFNDNGVADVDFVSVTNNVTDIDPDERYKIVKAPKDVLEISQTPAQIIRNGSSRENDEHYKNRFRYSKAIKSKTTKIANLSNLSKYIDNPAYIKIVDKNQNGNMEPGTVKIFVKHNTTDEIFASAVMDTFGAGIKFIGTTSVPVKDINGDKTVVKFTNATIVPISIDLTIRYSEVEYDRNILELIKNNILEYSGKRTYGLGDRVYATEFIPSIMSAINYSDAVSEIQIKRADDASEYSNVISLSENEIPKFLADNITINLEAANNETN